MRKSTTLMAVALLLVSLAPAAFSAWFPIYDGEHVVFLGDSITEQRLYTTFIEAYTIGRFPRWNLQFRNAGWGGDTAAGGLKRFQRDVLPLKPSLVVIAFGMNDGKYTTFDQSVSDGYLDSEKKLAEALKASGVKKVIFLGPGTVDVDVKPGLAPYPDTLKKMSDALAQVCKANDYQFIDWWTPLTNASKELKSRGSENTLIPDAVHPDIAGHLLMAYAALDAMDAPALVSEVTVSVPSLRTRALNAQVKELEQVGPGVKMKIEEKSLPMFVPDEAKLAMELAPVLTRLNREILIVNGLNPGSYDVKIDGNVVATVSDADLAKGINLALYKTPAWQQAGKLWDLIVKKNDLYFKRWRQVQLYQAPDWMDPKTVETMRSAAVAKLDKEISDLEAQIAQTAVPVPHLFEVSPTPKPEPS